MKINQKLIKARLDGVDPKHRAFIYDASIVIEFLRLKFMPIRYFFPDAKPVAGKDLTTGYDFKKTAKKHSMLMRDLYHLYLLWREEKAYTRTIETRYIFALIIRHLRFYQNGWEMYVHRVGHDQIWYVGPLVLRMDVPIEERGPIPEPVTADQTNVEANPMNEPSEEQTEPEEAIEPVKTVEIVPDLFKEAKFELVEPEWVKGSEDLPEF